VPSVNILGRGIVLYGRMLARPVCGTASPVVLEDAHDLSVGPRISLCSLTRPVLAGYKKRGKRRLSTGGSCRFCVWEIGRTVADRVEN
jgi:hypothetical protein